MNLQTEFQIIATASGMLSTKCFFNENDVEDNKLCNEELVSEYNSKKKKKKHNMDHNDNNEEEDLTPRFDVEIN